MIHLPLHNEPHLLHIRRGCLDGWLQMRPHHICCLLSVRLQLDCGLLQHAGQTYSARAPGHHLHMM